MKTIKPANNQLFCKPLEAEAKTKSGIILPSANMEKPKTAEVINVGDDVEMFRSKDIVVYKPYTTTDIKLDNQEYFLIHMEDVLGVVVETKEVV